MMKKERTYFDSVHFTGRIWMLSAVTLMLMVPAAICVYYNAWPEITGVLKGLLGVAPIYWTVCTIEVFTYAPMLGSGGTYLAFVTGNITNLKAPAAINSMEAAKVVKEQDAGLPLVSKLANRAFGLLEQKVYTQAAPPQPVQPAPPAQPLYPQQPAYTGAQAPGQNNGQQP